MRPLVMGPAEVATLKAVRLHAEANPVGLDELRRRAAAREPVTDPLAICELPFGFLVAFTIERHPGGWMRHVSVSVPTPGRVPSSQALEWIGRGLGMAMDLAAPDTHVYLEGPEGGPPAAVDVVEPMPHFRCAMCGGDFPRGDEAEARAEAVARGIDPAGSGRACDDCYKLTPWGAGPGTN